MRDICGVWYSVKLQREGHCMGRRLKKCGKERQRRVNGSKRVD